MTTSISPIRDSPDGARPAIATASRGLSGGASWARASSPNETLHAQVRHAASASEFSAKDSPVHSSLDALHALSDNAPYEFEVCRADWI